MKTAERGSLEDPEPRSEKEPHHGLLGFLGEIPGLVLMAFVLALIIRTFLFQAFYIPSPSMERTLITGDRVLVNKVPYYFHDPRRGDIIVFSNPNPEATPSRGLVGGFLHWLFQGLGFQQPENEDFIKRVIGLPGDVVEGKHGSVYVNGVKLNEPYLTQNTQPFPAKTVPAGKLFVMGDNRGNSLDSRFGLGYVPIDNVIGKAFVKIWPPSRFGLLH
ncbi:MAG: signal peptidase I [Actinomycetota bacterium]